MQFDDCETEGMHGAEAATFVRENFFVDDGLVSVSTIENVISLLKKGTELYKSGGFAGTSLPQIKEKSSSQDIGLDYPISEPMRNQWEKWQGELSLLEKMQSLRCIKPEKMDDIKIELRHFFEASTEGYGQCSYQPRTQAHFTWLRDCAPIGESFVTLFVCIWL